MSYEALQQHCRRISALEHLETVAAWDEVTMMPVGGAEARAAALATVRGLIHAEASAPQLGELIARTESESWRLGAWQQANLREVQRRYERAIGVAPALVEATSLAESRCEHAWRKLRAENDWYSFRPLLESVVDLRREIAAAVGDRLGVSPYDALLDGFEPGARSAQIAPLFARLGSVLPELKEQVWERQATEECLTPTGRFAAQEQRMLGLELMRSFGFDFERGRLDTNHHPICGGVPGDVRITARFEEGGFASTLMRLLHDTGYAKYEQHLPRAFAGQPVGRARSMAVRESQSLLLEMHVCRSREFAEFLAPHLARAFPEAARLAPAALTATNMFRMLTRVRPELIRSDADEVTYPCHIILRFELERELILGTLPVAELPERWDAGMQQLLGLSTAENYRDGCMQDVHWAAGQFGYYPTITLGALMAAQLFAAAQRAHPHLGEWLARGDFSGLDMWLNEHVWSQASLVSTADIVQRATGEPLGTAAFERHLRRRYLGEG